MSLAARLIESMVEGPLNAQVYKLAKSLGGTADAVGTAGAWFRKFANQHDAEDFAGEVQDLGYYCKREGTSVLVSTVKIKY